jgi:hypothetical protein
MRHLNFLTGGFGDGRFDQFNMEGESASGDSAAAEQFPETLRKAIEDGGYTDEQLYNCDETALYYKLLPNKS